MKGFKGNKGFTLIEIMLVLVIIGILAVVLVPRIGTMTNDIKLEGVYTNMRVAQAVASKVIQNYDASATQAQLDQLEDDIIDRLTDAKNPYTDRIGGVQWNTTTHAFVGGTGGAFTYDTGDTTNALQNESNASLKGMVGVRAYVSGSVKVDLIPFSSSGALVSGTNQIVTVSK